jgi:hypothetical protein
VKFVFAIKSLVPPLLVQETLLFQGTPSVRTALFSLGRPVDEGEGQALMTGPSDQVVGGGQDHPYPSGGVWTLAGHQSLGRVLCIVLMSQMGGSPPASNALDVGANAAVAGVDEASSTATMNNVVNALETEAIGAIATADASASRMAPIYHDQNLILISKCFI